MNCASLEKDKKQIIGIHYCYYAKCGDEVAYVLEGRFWSNFNGITMGDAEFAPWMLQSL